MTQLRSEEDLLTEVVAQVRNWLDDSAHLPVPAAGRRLADVLRDPDGLDFTVGFVDRVIRPEDHRVAAANLRALARNAPGFLPIYQRLLIKLGALVSMIAPGLVIPVARDALRRMVGHLLVDADGVTHDVAVGDVIHLRQVLVNLVNNAVKFTPEGGRVTVRAASDGAELVLTVRGVGYKFSADGA